MEWHRSGFKSTLRHTWETGIAGIPLIDVRYVNQWNEKLVIMIFQEGLPQPWREVFCKKQTSFPDPMVTLALDCNGRHIIEIRLQFPEEKENDKQTLKLFVDGEDVYGRDFNEECVAEPPERTVDEIIVAAGLESCIDAFRFEDITTEEELRLLTDEQMKELGVTKIGERNRLRTHVAPLAVTIGEVQPANQESSNKLQNEMKSGFARGLASEAGSTMFNSVFSL